MIDALCFPFDAAAILKNRKSIRRALLAEPGSRTPVRIAVLGGSTTHDIVSISELFLLNEGIEPLFWECEYAQYWQTAMFQLDTLRDFHPDIVFVHTTCRNLTQLPVLADSAETVEQKYADQLAHFTAMWDSLSALGCVIVQNNLDPPPWRLLGNRDAYDPHGHVRFIQRLNAAFADYAARHDHFYLHDIQYLAARCGLDRWHDLRAWYLYKCVPSLPAVPEFAHSFSCIVKSLFGKNRKALALDLDNTLWGGVISEDGPDGIVLGVETAVGEAYTAFQRYVQSLQSLGVLLAVCSKNDEERALEGLRHPDTVLTPEDFAAFSANWRPKHENLADIAVALHILPDSLVFVDDNPAERALVRMQLPGVAVPEVGTVESYITALDRAGYFEATNISADDLHRTEMLRADAQRQEARQRYADYADYLRSLEMRAVIDDFQPSQFARIAQLTNKSNQFNLTTRRYTLADIERLARDDGYIRLCGRLHDRFGDNGIVSIVLGRREDDRLHLELWLMSCRVLARDMELAMLDRLVECSRAAGIRELVGYYYPTAKNDMVRTLYDRFGFAKQSEDAQGNAVYTLRTEGYRPQNQVIALD